MSRDPSPTETNRASRRQNASPYDRSDFLRRSALANYHVTRVITDPTRSNSVPAQSRSVIAPFQPPQTAATSRGRGRSRGRPRGSTRGRARTASHQVQQLAANDEQEAIQAENDANNNVIFHRGQEIQTVDSYLVIIQLILLKTYII